MFPPGKHMIELISMHISFRSDAPLPTLSQILPWVKNKQLEACFHRAFSVIDRNFLDSTPVGSLTGTVRSTLSNLAASAVLLHIEVIRRILTKEEAAELIYDLDKLTDFQQWVPPLDPLVGPAGARRPKRKARFLQKRVLEFIREDGSGVEIEVGDE
jgi:hypothetical protein